MSNNKKWCKIQIVVMLNNKTHTERGSKVTIEEKVDIVSKIFAALEIVPQNKKDQLAGIIIGYSMASQFGETKGA